MSQSTVKVKINPKKLAEEIKCGIPDSILTQRYGLSAEQIRSAKKKLVDMELLVPEFLPQPWTCPNCGYKEPERPRECSMCGIVSRKFTKLVDMEREKRVKQEQAQTSTESIHPEHQTTEQPQKTNASDRVQLIAAGIGVSIIILVIGGLATKPSNTSPDNRTAQTSRAVRPTPTVHHGATSPADAIVHVLNTSYGGACKAELTGWMNKTLKLDWTSQTSKLHAAKIIAEIGTVKQKLYDDGVRYLQFPNDAGTYNVIDWKTGEKSSVNDRAPYYFR